MNWKEELSKCYDYNSTADFIETEIIEKLIVEIPDKIDDFDGGSYDEGIMTVSGIPLKQQLRTKWLGKESND